MSKIKIGIADDNQELCDLLISFFEKQKDLELVFAVNDGLKAMDAIRSHWPEVVLLDMVMPHLDGLGVLEGISKLEEDYHPKIVILSAVGQEVVTQKAMCLGAEYYILKPFRLEVLLKRIYQICEQTPSNEGQMGFMKTMVNENHDLEKEVTYILRKLGVPVHIKGYRYLRQAIMIVTNDVGMLESVTKELYPAVAQKNHTTRARVERSIRTAINIAWERGHKEAIQVLFGDISKKKPASAEFIAIIAEQLRMEQRTS